MLNSQAPCLGVLYINGGLLIACGLDDPGSEGETSVPQPGARAVCPTIAVMGKSQRIP